MSIGDLDTPTESTPLMESSSSTSTTAAAAAAQNTPTSEEPCVMEEPLLTENNNTMTMRTTDSERHRRSVWWTLIISVLLGLVSGTLYGFGRYSRDLRDTMHLTQFEVSRFGIMLDTGNYIGHPLTGLMYDKLGPRVSCFFAGIIVFVSYFSIYMGLADFPIWIVDIGFAGVGFGSGLGYIAGLGSTTKEFLGTPHLSRAVGFVAAGYGLSSTMVGISYHEVGLSHFFLLWAVLVAIVNMFGIGILRSEEQQQINDNDDDANEMELADVENNMLVSGQESDRFDLSEGMDNGLHGNGLEDQMLLSEGSETSASSSSSASSSESAIVVCTEWNSWRHLDFWLLFFSFSGITGCGLFVINNVSTMVQSIGEKDSLTGTLVFMLSICNVFGRILMGSLADSPKLQKMDLLKYSSLVMALALCISAVAGESKWSLTMTIALVAMAYGGSWVLIVGILADKFGRDHFGKDYGLIAMGPAISGMIFNFSSAWFYQQHADDTSGTCLGAICYHDSYLITACAALVGYLILSRMTSSSSAPEPTNR